MNLAAKSIGCRFLSPIQLAIGGACRPTFAPILINRACRVRNDPWLIDMGKANRRNKLPRLQGRVNDTQYLMNGQNQPATLSCVLHPWDFPGH